MRVKGRKIWALALAGALLIMFLCFLSGCGSSKSTNLANGQKEPAVPGNPRQIQGEGAQSAPDGAGMPGQGKDGLAGPAQGQVQPGVSGKNLQILQNGTFEMGHYGWSPQEGKVLTEENGNRCMRAKYTWGLFQFLQVAPGETYEITCRAKQDQAPMSPARMCIIHYDSDHKIMTKRADIVHIPGTQWEDFPLTSFTVPEDAVFTKLFLLSNGEGSVCFDNVSISPVAGDSAG
ncbi:MAG: hypothetical protein BWY80_01501 [Firmicutes bacterium ADurb.Bin456]|nr:MAG: hypothetical protein BWY80_01501 [Firmicutes bacterium ADurb.Bin456]